MTQDLHKRMRCEEHVGECAVARGRECELQTSGDCVEAVTKFLWIHRLAEPHRAETLREIDVPPAEMSFMLEKAHIECRVVRD